ncbi:hypothetical protein MMC18_008296, partial [Xylographa bjoerkii]|nr:hypothetical protein [Xylographa bjoerkii]
MHISTSLLSLLFAATTVTVANAYLSERADYADVDVFDKRDLYESELYARDVYEDAAPYSKRDLYEVELFARDAEAEPEAFVEALENIVFKLARRYNPSLPANRNNRPAFAPGTFANLPAPSGPGHHNAQTAGAQANSANQHTGGRTEYFSAAD